MSDIPFAGYIAFDRHIYLASRSIAACQRQPGAITGIRPAGGAEYVHYGTRRKRSAEGRSYPAPVPSSLHDTTLRKYLDFYRYIFPALAWEDPDMCIDLLNRASDHYKARGRKLFAGICLHMIGQHYYMREEFAPAFDNLLRANDLFRETGYANIPEIGRYLHELALAHYYFRDYHKVIDLMQESVRLPPYNRNLDMQRYNNLGLAYRNTGQPDSALYYFEHTLRLADQYHDPIWISIVNANIGRCVQALV